MLKEWDITETRSIYQTSPLSKASFAVGHGSLLKYLTCSFLSRWAFLQSFATPGRTAGWRTNDLRPRCRAAEGADNDVSPQPDLANGNEQQPHVSESATNASSRPPPVHISVRHMNARFTARYTLYSPAACRPGCQKPGRDLPRGGGRFLHASKRAPTSTHVQRSRRPARSRSHSPDQSARPDRCIERSALPSVL